MHLKLMIKSLIQVEHLLKKYNDLISCTKLPTNTKLLFIDDKCHKGMIHKNVYYFQIKPYIYNYSFYQILLKTKFLLYFFIKELNNFDITLTQHLSYKLLSNYLSNDDNIDIESCILIEKWLIFLQENNCFNNKSTTKIEEQVDNITSKQMLIKINKYLTINNSNT